MFRLATGKSAFEYLRDVRLERARQALISTDDGIAEIAASVGLSSHSHLTRLFIKKFGISPSCYRREKS
ncbi:helix-turn-helix transcriptional regulator (plasmid) [Rhizobium grahamii]|uniref:Helix-turn-helix transcriptional regulator n=1 Tax=Rhizobium grahamii TaxID=1120045 RepID=A0A5Q0CFG1_9HYPH|nr:helix-turn-helix transcriptional regulator [Rhizobium grahamii]QRM52566.1 helix-turn-helix transcriptional regulator [Rhizobium sp. BG6]